MKASTKFKFKFKFKFKSKLNNRKYKQDDRIYTLSVEFIANDCNTLFTTVVTGASGEGGKDDKGRCNGGRADAEQAGGDAM